ncbi:hypothetical protein [Acetomicrobium hydrogeniformans]|jgi:hypothetical protein|uniref:Tetratricopeptide repeat protein n=1 Tax=Acetomicrobium hydrogeniformans ATCC BAA-1850 TaxID=592015 RepID=A0A0T5XDV7_9BACT|nr:hypothetical protein [Acetomicrobium hydrogeniformans]KRT36110.1 hypothetical protein HMPREF1705_03369 [Acetomicrobium hydrogeniformans ATCC BAA-1850]
MRIFLTVTIFFVLFFGLFSPVEGSELYLLPEVNKIEAEKHMIAARRYFLSGDYFRCIDELKAAQSENIYLVNVYLLRSLCERRLGMWDRSLESIRYYLEVENGDGRAKLIKEQIVKENEYVKNLLYGGVDSSLMKVFKQPLSMFFDLPLGANVKASTVGKVSYFEGMLWICDIDGNKITLIEEGQKPHSFKINKPVAVVPFGLQRILVATRDGQLFWGDLKKGEKGDIEVNFEKIISLSAILSDAVSLGEKIAVVSDVLEGRLIWIDLEEGKEISDWRPSEGIRFEPLALSYSGYLMAIADRASDSLIALDPWSKKIMFQEKAQYLRDVEWFTPTEVIGLSEDGSVYIGNVIKRNFAKQIEVKITNGWCLTRRDEELVVLDTTLRNIYSIRITPELTDLMAFANIINKSKGVADLSVIRFKAGLNVPVLDEYGEDPPFLAAAFGEMILPTKWEKTTHVKMGSVVNVTELEDYEKFMRGIYHTNDAWPLRLVIEQNPIVSGISDDFVLMLAGFCLREGIAVDLLMKDGPLPLSLIMLSHVSGGKIYFYPFQGEKSIEQIGLQGELVIMLPERNSLFKEMTFEPLLAVFGNLGGIPFRDWTPIDFYRIIN